jgi:hypothetical protein
MGTLMLIKLTTFQTKKLTNGFMFSFGSGDVSWSNKKQPTITLSSTNVENKGPTMTICEEVW